MNVKQGDLAITTNAFNCENIGKVVFVNQFFGTVNGIENVWGVIVQDPVKGINFDTLTAIEDTYVYWQDAWLCPVSGIPEVIGVDERVKESV